MRYVLLTVVAALLAGAGVAVIALAATPSASVDEVTASSVKLGSLRCGTTYNFQLREKAADGTLSDPQTVEQATSACPTPTPTPSPSPSPTDPAPIGPSGTWRLVFQDEFNGTALDTTRWSAMDGGRMNNVTTRARNITVSGGIAMLQLSSSSEGAEICSGQECGAGANAWWLPVGGVAEARVLFPGTSGQDIYNWPAWWVSGPNWPAAGEHDIAEGLGGDLTVNYHGTSNSQNYGTPSGGPWGSAYHVFTLHRKASSADVYWDGRLVKSYPTGDNGAGESLIVNIGKSTSRKPVLGAPGAVRVDYVRGWVTG